MNITQNGKVTNSYSYGMDGQIATATAYGSSSTKATGGQETESFIWDGLALLKRDTTEYVNEPAVTGGNPILANGKGLFNDMLGTTLGKYDGKKFIDNQRTSFGSGSKEGFFTGKPHIAGLGYAFLFRNYRPGLGKWQTKDPLGYPDGFNNLAYCNNMVTGFIDYLGGESHNVTVEVDGTVTGKELSYSTMYTVTFTAEEAGGTVEKVKYGLLWTLNATIEFFAELFCDAPSCSGHTCDETTTIPFTMSEEIIVLSGSSMSDVLALSQISVDSFTITFDPYLFTYMTCE